MAFFNVHINLFVLVIISYVSGRYAVLHAYLIVLLAFIFIVSSLLENAICQATSGYCELKLAYFYIVFVFLEKNPELCAPKKPS